jgi:hypothetical protein
MQHTGPNVAGPLAGGIIAAMGLLWLLIIMVGVALTVFWVLAIIDCAQRQFQDPNEKIIWILVIVFTHWIGTLIYWFVGRPRGTRTA